MALRRGVAPLPFCLRTLVPQEIGLPACYRVVESRRGFPPYAIQGPGPTRLIGRVSAGFSMPLSFKIFPLLFSASLYFSRNLSSAPQVRVSEFLYFFTPFAWCQFFSLSLRQKDSSALPPHGDADFLPGLSKSTQWLFHHLLLLLFPARFTPSHSRSHT